MLGFSFVGTWLGMQRYGYRLQQLWGRQQSETSEAPLSLSHCWQLTPVQAGRDWREVEFLVVDTETSGLNVNDSELLSVGWLVIARGRIQLRSAEHLLLKPRNSVGDSATIHTLRDCELDQGLTEAELLQRFLTAAAGRVLVFHHAPLDLAFLNGLCRKFYGAPLLLPVVDTLQLEKRSLERREQPIGPNMLRLASCCSRYNLPAFRAHNALTDALATAELLLAQISHKGEGVRLQDLL